MSLEATAIKNNLQTVVDGLQCAPGGTGLPGDCIEDLWAGVGSVGYADSGVNGVDAFRSLLDVQENPNVAALSFAEPSSSSFNEPLTFAVHAAITGQGGAAQGMSGVLPRTNCPVGRYGHPCFRGEALPIVVLATDEPPITGPGTVQNPLWNPAVRNEMNSQGARFIGVLGNNATPATEADLQTMATDTGAVDANNGNAPVVVNADANAANAIATGVRTLVEGIRVKATVVPVDDSVDSVDVVAAFIDHIEVQPIGPNCTSGLTTTDTNSDSHADTYHDAAPGTPLCWRIVAKTNTTVNETDEPQLFRVTMTTLVEGRPSESQDVFFAVPAA